VPSRLIDGSSQSGAGGIFHLDQDNFDGFHFTNNCVLNGDTGFFVDGTRNVGTSSSTRTPLVQGNLFESNGAGANIGRKAIDGGHIQGNTFKDNEYDGLQGGPQNVTITENIFEGNGRAGLRLTGFGGETDSGRGAIGNTITKNCFLNNGHDQTKTLRGGVRFDAQYVGTVTTNILNSNNIVGNTPGVLNRSDETINAEENFWGASNGPGGEGPGSGDAITNTGEGSIVFYPFDVADVGNTPCSPLPVKFSCAGFEPPMDEPVSVKKKNRVLPLKMVLFDENGMEVTDVDVTAPPLVEIDFTGGYPTEPPGEDFLPAGQGDEGNQFVFTGSRWQFNLQTKNFSGSGTYTIRAVSGDPSEYLIDPTCIATFLIE